MAFLVGVGGLVAGMVVAAASYYGAMRLLGDQSSAALIVAAVAGGLGGIYAAIAFGSRVYRLRFSSGLGFLLDLSWSLLNTVAGLLVWLPACLASGAGFVHPDDRSRRSGTFVYRNNPRGGGYAATTVGTVVAGGWSSHEETHVWQARIFGPAYLLAYGICLVMNMLFRLVIGQPANATHEAYYRVCFEDWAYWPGSSGADVSWGGWIGGFALALLYTGLLILIPVGIVSHKVLLAACAGIELLLYHLIRNLVQKGH